MPSKHAATLACVSRDGRYRPLTERRIVTAASKLSPRLVIRVQWPRHEKATRHRRFAPRKPALDTGRADVLAHAAHPVPSGVDHRFFPRLRRRTLAYRTTAQASPPRMVQGATRAVGLPRRIRVLRFRQRRGPGIRAACSNGSTETPGNTTAARPVRAAVHLHLPDHGIAASRTAHMVAAVPRGRRHTYDDGMVANVDLRGCADP